jgi:hypothetical protein
MAAPNAAANAERIQRIEKQLEFMNGEGYKVITIMQDRITQLERLADKRGERVESLTNQIKGFENHLYRMENSLLNEFKISQEIMKSMLDHDLSIDRAKFEMKLELERREADLLNKQKDLELDLQKQKAEIRKGLLIKIGAIALPIATALATVVTLYLENFLK